jgi:hypothetical protein
MMEYNISDLFENISFNFCYFFKKKVLCIEAPQPEAEKPQEIPIDRCELPKKEYIK